MNRLASRLASRLAAFVLRLGNHPPPFFAAEPPCPACEGSGTEDVATVKLCGVTIPFVQFCRHCLGRGTVPPAGGAPS